ncbi:MAG: nuclear transport factor 2 family protein [Caulobacteraceae bacterium]
MAHKLVGVLTALPFLMAAQPGAAAGPGDTTAALARDVGRLESVRAVKNLQRLYAQYEQAGRWSDLGGLFADKGRLAWGDQTIEGRAAIAGFVAKRSGGALGAGLKPGALAAELIEEPLVNLSADGQNAKARWMSLSFLGDGQGSARFEGGLYENAYVREGGRWRIAEAHYYPQYEGNYAEGWTNVGRKDLPVVPTHFTPDEAGVPIPAPTGPAPKSTATLAELKARIGALNDEDAVRNLQNAYGYYVDRKMWDDVADLFAKDGSIEVGGAAGRGPDGVRKALVASMGPAGLRHGELNDRPLYDTLVRVLPGGREAETRGIELGMLGDADKNQAAWEISVFHNRFVKEGGIWKLKAMKVGPVMKADYHRGWGDGGVGGRTSPALPAFLDLKPPKAAAVGAAGTLADARRRYQRSLAFDGAENVNSSYGYYIDDGHWPEMGAIFGKGGSKEAPFAGFYKGADRIAGYGLAQYGNPPTTRAGVSFHWLIQPVILVAHDGRSANIRSRLFQPRTSKDLGDPPSFLGASMYAGMYQNQAMLEDGVWRLWNLALDEPYFSSVGWKGGWAAAKDAPPQDQPPPSPILKKYPPDVPISQIGKREEHFRGGVGQIIQWPAIQPMWFPYRNLVSGRTPENFIADCAVCLYAPEFSMTRHGYQMPPTGPSIDGLDAPGR